MDLLKTDSIKTAVALAQAYVRGDSAAMRNLWNGTNPDDSADLIDAMAALPALVMAGIGIQHGEVCDPEEYYGHVLDLLSQVDG